MAVRMRKVPQRLWCLNYVFGGRHGVTLLEEVRHERQALNPYSLSHIRVVLQLCLGLRIRVLSSPDAMPAASRLVRVL